ncbi:MAG TPA: hypothetical protein PKM65_20340 [Spirochaetota bacterium]|nr:hypothetical protein [Spirochaetota bacterium]
MSRLIVVPKQNPKTVYQGSWTGVGGAVEVNDENIVTPGFFRKNYGLAKPDGSLLVPGVDFFYDKRLDTTDGGGVNVWDTGVSGALATGKYMRLVDNTSGKNITDPTGFGKKIIAKLDCGGNPALDEVYVDPAQGMFKGIGGLTYWSRFESLENIANANFKKYAPYYAGTIRGLSSIKFGSCLYQEAYWPAYGCGGISGTIYPHGDTKGFNRGSLSAWSYIYAWRQNSYFDVSAYVNYIIGSSISVIHYSTAGSSPYVALYVNGSEVGRFYPGWIVDHIFVVWDIGAGLSGGKTVKVYVDNVLRIQTDTVFNDTGGSSPTVVMYAYSCNWDHDGAGYAHLDNLKLWDEPDENILSTEWNGGAGNEFFTGGGASLKASYLYVVGSSDPVSVTEANAVGTKAIIQSV